MKIRLNNDQPIEREIDLPLAFLREGVPYTVTQKGDTLTFVEEPIKVARAEAAHLLRKVIDQMQEGQEEDEFAEAIAHSLYGAVNTLEGRS